jgi:hypothetical protein
LENNLEKALIHTSKGNMSVEDLTYKNGFDWQPNGVVFWEEYWLGDEMVKRSAHAFVLPVGTSLQLSGGKIG